jgi:hypothetical protein
MMFSHCGEIAAANDSDVTVLGHFDEGESDPGTAKIGPPTQPDPYQKSACRSRVPHMIVRRQAFGE